MTKASEDIKKMIETMIELLDFESIVREVDDQIDKETAEFKFTIDGAITPVIFNRVISDFVKHIYKTALRFPRMLSDHEALAEAIHLLSNYSEAEGPDRYGAILTFVIAGVREELESVLLKLSEIIKEIERRKYKRWVFTSFFWSRDWETQRRIVALYKELISQSLSEEMHILTPEQLVEYFEELINIDLICRNILKQIGFDKGERS